VRPSTLRFPVLVAALLAAFGLGACATIPQEESPRVPRACARLANAFYRIADQKNHGVTKEAQIEVMHEATRRPGADAMRRHWLHMIDLVYRFSDASAQEIGMTVLDHCAVDGRGQAVVITLWPTR